MQTNQTAVNSDGIKGLVADWSGDQEVFRVSWGKAMMWIFLLSDTFVFSCFLIAYMVVRISAVEPWPNASEVFALEIGGQHMPLILIAIMTFVLITSSGTMAMAVNYGYCKDKVKAGVLMLITAFLGLSFVGIMMLRAMGAFLEDMPSIYP